jgi:hypothetical protein
LVWLDDVDDGWFVEDEADWFAEDEAGWFVEDEADWFAEDEADWFAEAEPDRPDEDAELPATEFRPGMSAFACFAWSMAAWVRGPMMPSTGPGSKPLSFSACWSCFTCSSPCEALPAEALCEPLSELPLALAPLVALEPLLALEPLVALEPDEDIPEADWLAEAEADGWLVEDEADWLDEADGWFAEADFDLSSDWPAAIAEVAAITAATRASFLNCMVGILSFGQLTAIRFGPPGPIKFRAATAPSGAGRLRGFAGGRAT